MNLRSGVWQDLCVRDAAGDVVDLSAVGAFWIRRPTRIHASPATPNEALAHFVNSETSWFLEGLWQCVERPIVNRPFVSRLASMKAFQLGVAARLGFSVPETTLGNEPSAVRTLWGSSGGQMVVKGVREGMVLLDDESERTLYTTPLAENDLVHDGKLSGSPSIWQEYVPKSVELRVNVVGESVLSAEIHSQLSEKTRHDWRNYDFENTPHLVHELPAELQRLCIELVAELGLYSGAIDMVLTPEGEYVFLEINPGGEWMWIEKMCGLPIAEAYARLFSELIKSPDDPRRAK